MNKVLHQIAEIKNEIRAGKLNAVLTRFSDLILVCLHRADESA
jgi:hypothetical protein